MNETQNLINKEVAAISPVLNMACPPSVSYGHERFFDFTHNVYNHAQENILTTPMDDEGYGRIGPEMPVQVLLLMGDPNSGKTFIDRVVEKELIPRLDNELPLFQDHLYSKHVKKLNWEEHGELPAIRKKLIKSAIDEPFERHELHSAEDELVPNIVNAIKHPYSAVVQIELPGGIAAMVDGSLKVYRPYGPRIVRQLVQHQGEFHNLKYEVWAAAFAAGPFLQGMRKGRERVRRARTLKEAEEYAHLYGIVKKGEKLTSEYRKALKNGAYLKQFPVIDMSINSLMEAIKDDDLIVNARRMSETFQFDELSQLLAPHSSDSWKQHPWVQAARWQLFLQSIGLDSERAFIGFYNPTPSQSGLEKEDIIKLKADLARP